jgi:hypothetical protein
MLWILEHLAQLQQAEQQQNTKKQQDTIVQRWFVSGMLATTWCLHVA